MTDDIICATLVVVYYVAIFAANHYTNKFFNVK